MTCTGQAGPAVRNGRSGQPSPTSRTSSGPQLLAELEGWQLTYSRVPDGGDHPFLFLANADGTDAKQLDRLRGDKQAPHWSPQGDRFAIRWLPRDEDHTPLLVLSADGSHVFDLTAATGLRGWSPSWSPNGERLVAAATPRVNVPPSLYVMSATGTHLRRITPLGMEAQYAAWSPTAEVIAFSFVVDGGFDLFTVHPDGSGLTRLTNEGRAGRNNWPMWSPDGTQIAWGRGDGLWVMDSDGSDQHPVTSVGGVPGSWAPGPFITFQCPVTGGIGICVIRADGSGLTRLLGGIDAAFPGWKPKSV